MKSDLRCHQVCWAPVKETSARSPLNLDPAEMKAVPGVGYPSVHCGLTASRVRSRAHLLKSGEKRMTRLNLLMNTFLLKPKHRINVNVPYTLVSCSPCCDGRLCTHAFCTWVRSKADLKENGESRQTPVVSRHPAPTSWLPLGKLAVMHFIYFFPPQMIAMWSYLLDIV